MTLVGLGLIATLLTIGMFNSRQSMLGFPCAIFWAILGGYSYSQFTTAWVDWQFYVMFASLMGMVPFSIYAGFGLREKRDTLGDESMEGRGKEKEFIDEGRKEPDMFADDGIPESSERTEALHNRASRRRAKPKRKGEFDF